MTDSAGGLSGRQWSGVAGGAFFLAAVGLVALISGSRSNPYVTAALALSAGGGAVAGLLWWRFVERPGAYTCSRG